MSNVTSFADAYASAKPQQLSWKEPIELPSILPDVPAFGPSLLPTQLEGWVQDIAERLCVAPDFAAMPAMAAAASLVGAKVGVRPQQHTSWTEAGNMWSCIVGPPGMLKSPVMGEVLGPLRRLDVQADKAYQAELSKFDDAGMVDKMAMEEAQKRARKAIREGNRELAEEILAEAPVADPPVAKRFLVTDATVEKLGEICADNPNGILVYRDELLTLLTELEAQDKAAARGFFLTGWTGQDFYTFDRIGRGTIRIPRVNLSLCGTTQPTRIAGYLRRSLKDKNDGMFQRLQLLAWPDKTKEFVNVDRPPHASAREMAYGCYNMLAELNSERRDFARDPFDEGDGMPFLRLSPGAIEQFVDYRTQLEAAIRSDDMPIGLTEHLSKFRGLIPRISLIVHLASNGVGHVSEEAMEKALGWSRYLEGHARRVYGSIGLDNSEAAQSIWKRIQRGELSDGFTERDIYSRHWANLSKGERLTQGLKTLVEYDWLAAEQKATGGRPTTIYRINPKGLERTAIAA